MLPLQRILLVDDSDHRSRTCQLPVFVSSLLWGEGEGGMVARGLDLETPGRQRDGGGARPNKRKKSRMKWLGLTRGQ